MNIILFIIEMITFFTLPMRTQLKGNIYCMNDVEESIKTSFNTSFPISGNLYTSLKRTMNSLNTAIINSVFEDHMFWSLHSQIYKGCLCHRNGSGVYKDSILIPVKEYSITITSISNIIRKINFDLFSIATHFSVDYKRVPKSLKSNINELTETLFWQSVCILSISTFLRSFYDELTPHYRGLHVSDRSHLEIAHRFINTLNKEIDTYNKLLYKFKKLHSSFLQMFSDSIEDINKDPIIKAVCCYAIQVYGLLPPGEDIYLTPINLNLTDYRKTFFERLMDPYEKKSFLEQLFFGKQGLYISSGQEELKLYYKNRGSKANIIYGIENINPLKRIEIPLDLILKRRALSIH